VYFLSFLDEKKKPSASALYEAEIKEIRNHLQNWEGQINGVMTHVKNEIRSITGSEFENWSRF
jgi:hypothetical protein